MAVLAHPDDESLGFGGTLARYASEGVKTFLLTATRGENGRHGPSKSSSPEHLGRLREAELLAASRVLSISEVHLLDYIDGSLDRAHPAEAIDRIASHIRRVRPHVVLTFGPEGAYGHPDHIAISQLATSAVVAAAGATGSGQTHRVSKLYYIEWSRKKWEAYQSELRGLISKVDGIERR